MAATAASSVLIVLPACPPQPPDQDDSVAVFRRSKGGRRISQAALKRNANLIFRTREAATSPAHPGDNSKIVEIRISRALFNLYFPGGRTMVDLRQV